MVVVIAAGGTGGHLYPAVALAREFLRRDPRIDIVFIGTTRGIESKILAHEGFELECLNAKPVMGKSWVEAVQGLLSLPPAVWRSLAILRRRRADLVIGVGGYTSPAMLLAAFLSGTPRVILEPNACPGMANKAVGPVAQRVFLAFESAAGSFDAKKVRVVGTPIRREFLVRDRPAAGPPDPTGRRRLLVFGGSQGAKAINSAVIEALPAFKAMRPGLIVTHQTGEPDYARVSTAYREAGVEAEVVPFLYDMPSALRAAELVVARAGAMTVAELTASGAPAILIPLPTAIYDHQSRNAEVMERAGAAVIIPQRELTGASLADAVAAILGDEKRLRAMSERSAAMRRVDAAETIVRECYALMEGRDETDRPCGAGV